MTMVAGASFCDKIEEGGYEMPLNLDYYYGNEAEQYSFYRIPKVIFTNSRYRGVSVEVMGGTVMVESAPGKGAV